MNTLNRINNTFCSGKAYIGYLTAGDGGIGKTLTAALALIAGGVNMLEIGVPFSDPIADGPVIQRAASRALAIGTNLQDILWLTREIRKVSQIPLILFSYYNPIFAILTTAFMRNAKLAGIDGLLVVDCPIEESTLIHAKCLENDIAPIYVITPTTTHARLQKITALANGFLYYACRKGTTGSHPSLPMDFNQRIIACQSAIHLPIVVGFGISDRQMVTQALQYADGVVVGSLFVKALEDGASASQLTALANKLFCGEEII